MDVTLLRKPRFDKVATAQGDFWTSGKATLDDLKSYLRTLQPDGFFTKVADIGGSSEEGFEQAFASLAYAYLKDKAPRLLDFMIGFQLVERNEDNTKAMGLFGFSVGNQWLYAPVFFLSGDLKGHELLYIKQQDTFVPMKENWVNYLMSRKPHVLGEGSQHDTYQLGGMQPDVSRLSRSPSSGMGKTGVDAWARPALPLIAAFKVKAASTLYPGAKAGTKLAFDQVVQHPLMAALAGVADRFDLGRVLSSDFALLKTAYDVSQSNPNIQRGFDRFYGSDCFLRWGNLHKQAAAKSRNNLLPVREKKASAPRQVFSSPLSLIPDSPRRAHPLDSGALRIYVKLASDSPTDQTYDNLTDADREKLLQDTVLIKDERDPQETSQAYSTQVSQKLMNPSETGLYNVLERPGEFTRMLLISNPYSNDGRQGFVTVIRLNDGDKEWLNSHHTNVWADELELAEDYKKWFESLPEKSDLTTGAYYVAISEAGTGTVPFKVREDYGKGDYKVDFQEHCSYDQQRGNNLPRVASQDIDREYVSPYGAKLSVDPEGPRQTKVRAIQGDLRVPSNYKFLKLSDPPKPKNQGSDGCVCSILPPGSDTSDSSGDGDATGSEPRPISLGKIEDIQMLFTEKTARMKLYADQHEVTISTDWAGHQRSTKQAAMLCLVRDHGLNEAAARELVKTASLKSSAIYRIRYAEGFGPLREKQADNNSVLQNGPGAPGMLPQEMGYETYGGRSGSRVTEPQEQHQIVPGLDGTRYDPQVYNNWANYTHEDFQHTMGQAQQAAQTGQKEVFDTAMIGGLLKSVRQDSLVDKYLGDLMKALDKLGRILFLFYWHQEEFEERYGKQDLPELEDSLRNSFESLGDITLFLKEKTVEPAFASQGGDPDIEESARN